VFRWALHQIVAMDRRNILRLQTKVAGLVSLLVFSNGTCQTLNAILSRLRRVHFIVIAFVVLRSRSATTTGLTIFV
jgi:hypothetical protein